MNKVLYITILVLSLQTQVILSQDNDFNYKDPAPHARSQEIEEITQGLLRSDRGHILLTGKSGTDFEAILEEVRGEFAIAMKSKGYRPAFNTFNATDLNSITNTVINSVNTKVPSLITVNFASQLSQINFGIEKIVALLDKKFGVNSPDKIFSKFIFVTDSASSRKLTIDEDFSRLTTKVTLKEHAIDDAIKAFKKNYNRKLGSYHISYKGITDKALEYASSFYQVEHPGIDKLQALNELVDGAIVLKSRSTTSTFVLEESDIRKYIQLKSKADLMPGDKNFNRVFDKKWTELQRVYGGDEGLKYLLKDNLLKFFSQVKKKKVESWVLHGAPGAGKTYLGEVVADTFFRGALLKISGAELKSKSDMSKLMGSPPGYVGSEQQRSILTKFISENPSGGVIVIEEADYMNRDIVQFFTNTKTDKVFKDGLGKEWDLSNFILIQNTNIGQDAIIPTDSKNAMTWAQYHMRVAQMSEQIEIDGKMVNVVKQSELGRMQRDYIEQIVLGSNPNEDTSQVAQEANKQKRRDKHFFVQSPSEQDLLGVAKINLAQIKKELLLTRQVELLISPKSLKKIIDVDHYDFFKGYSYVEEQLEKNITSKLSSLNLRESDRLKIQVVDGMIIYSRNDGVVELKEPLTARKKVSLGAWSSSSHMNDNIKSLARSMAKYLKGSQKEIGMTVNIMKKALTNPNARKTVTLLGTTGNGKTQYAKALAIGMFGSDDAMFSITGLNSPSDLNDYFRSSTGLIGSNRETEFERWFKSRQKAGGGVILLDELLSYYGLSGHQLSEKVAVFNELYRFLDEGKLKIAGKIEDASSFIPVITGNSLQEVFQGLPAGPDGELEAERIEAELSQKEIVEYFSKIGIDAPKIARLGHIFVKGPLKQSIAREIIVLQTKSKLNKLIKSSGYTTTLNLDPKILTILSEKLPTSDMGFRNVERGLEKALEMPITGILSDIENVQSIQAKLDGKFIRWSVNDKPVALASVLIEDVNIEEMTWEFKDQFPQNALDKTPDFSSIFEDIKQNEGFNRYVVKIHEAEGHWFTRFRLTGENSASFISMIPGKGFLGYVRSKEIKTTMNLSNFMREMVVLEAGHRSVILKGIHAPGGGTRKRDWSKAPTDDLGKIQQQIDGIINNKIFPEYSELHSDAKKELFRLTMHQLIQEMTDFVITNGMKQKNIDDLLLKLDEDTYLTGDYLDEYAKNYKENYKFNPFDELQNALDHGVKVIMAKRSTSQKLIDKLSPSDKFKLLKTIRKTLTEDINSERSFDCNKLYGN